MRVIRRWYVQPTYRKHSQFMPFENFTTLRNIDIGQRNTHKKPQTLEMATIRMGIRKTKTLKVRTCML